jgi:cell division protein FtsX
MIARITYAFREMWASFRRNLTLTAAAILTSAIALLLVGTTLLIQRAFDNLLVQWRGDVEMIVFVRSDRRHHQVCADDHRRREVAVSRQGADV